ncbi:hypothetical protein BH23CHL5_BH23CHL5_19800 [soil metagenome]
MNKSDPDRTYRDAMAEMIAERWLAVWESVPVAIKGADPEGVHDVRVASRRLRAAMDVAREAFPASWYVPLLRVAKSLTAELGEVRDRDVQIEHLRAERAASSPGDRVGIDRLISRLEHERDAARAEMEAYLEELLHSGAKDETLRRFGGEPGRSGLESSRAG